MSNLKVGGSVLNEETSSSLQYAATLHKDNFGCTIQTTQASQESFCMFGHHFVSETKNIMPQDSKFAKEKHAIRSNIAFELNLFFSDFLMENNIEVDRHFGFISEMDVDCAEDFNAQFVNRWANFESSQIKDSKMAKKGKALSPVVLSSIIQTSVFQWEISCSNTGRGRIRKGSS
jgi:hypothetical protein